MSTTEAGRPTASQPDGSDVLSFQAVIDATRRLDELSCARVIGQVAEAVHAAQKAGQPLGTLTPSAIVLASDGSVQLAPGAGAARYTAPEKLRGGSGDRRSDVFSLGVVLWEALAHEPLFDGASDAAIKQAVLAGAIRPASEYNANVPAELDAICQRALAAEPANRYQSAKVMAAEIDAVLGDAGYPETNDAIATYVGRWFATEPNKPAPPSNKTSP
ncbi:MAG: protein kinase, partial [Myxococcales bacterium]|nr:protein kinase [Myxococcales bacterium]